MKLVAESDLKHRAVYFTGAAVEYLVRLDLYTMTADPLQELEGVVFGRHLGTPAHTHARKQKQQRG